MRCAERCLVSRRSPTQPTARGLSVDRRIVTSYSPRPHLLMLPCSFWCLEIKLFVNLQNRKASKATCLSSDFRSPDFARLIQAHWPPRSQSGAPRPRGRVGLRDEAPKFQCKSTVAMIPRGPSSRGRKTPSMLLRNIGIPPRTVAISWVLLQCAKRASDASKSQRGNRL